MALLFFFLLLILLLDLTLVKKLSLIDRSFFYCFVIVYTLIFLYDFFFPKAFYVIGAFKPQVDPFARSSSLIIYLLGFTPFILIFYLIDRMLSLKFIKTLKGTCLLSKNRIMKSGFMVVVIFLGFLYGFFIFIKPFFNPDQHFYLNLGTEDIKGSFKKFYVLEKLPPGRTDIRLKVTFPEGIDGQNWERAQEHYKYFKNSQPNLLNKFNPWISLTMVNERGKLVMEVKSHLSDWWYPYWEVKGKKAIFNGPRRTYKNLADGGEGTYFKPRKGAKYILTLEVKPDQTKFQNFQAGLELIQFSIPQPVYP